ncbi:hypothetical protein NKH74_32390 [Mesorhizobium sp. M0933]|uniref:hypothetical protein n=1 Tax=Mesorhizobium sp. M0933 TaxID=2957030 RepID=UPI00333A3396
MPRSFKIGAHVQQLLALGLAERFRPFGFEGVEFGFALSHNRKRSIPAPLKFACHEPIVGIDGVILALRMGRFIACLFKRARSDAPSVPTASSTRSDPKLMHGSVPWLRNAPRQ